MQRPLATWGGAVATATVTALALLVWATLAAGARSQAPLLIAVEGPQTGEQAANGLDQLRGVRLAVRQLNARGGLWDGRKVAIYAADDKGVAANAKKVARQVIARGIRFVIGPYNSSVGISNLRLYRRNQVLPVWMTSRDETAGAGATVQPMNTQIAPIEERYVSASARGRSRCSWTTLRTAPSRRGWPTGYARRSREDGISVTWTSIRETTDPSSTSDYYAERVAQALTSGPDLVYVSTYFPEGIEIAQGARRVRRHSALPDGARQRRQRLRRQDDPGRGAALRLQRCSRRHRDALRQGVRAPVPGSVRQDARSLGLVHV